MAVISNWCRALTFRGVIIGGLACGLSACEGAGTTPDDAASTPPPADYLTVTEQYSALTDAAVKADYPLFARHIGADDPASVVAALTGSFKGQPFDAYTRRAVDAPDGHKRMIELRTTSGRLYLYLALEKVATGWNLSSYKLTRNRAEAEAGLSAAIPSG